MWGSYKRTYQRLLVLSVTFLVVMCGVTTRPSAESLTVDEAVRLALHNNPTFQAQHHTIAVAEGEWRQVCTFPNNPRLEWEGRGGRDRNEIRQDARTYTVKLSQELPL